MIQEIPSKQSKPLSLLAEDDDMIRELVAVYLQRLGYEVVSCKNGEEAIASFENAHRFDLIVTDLIMPELGGEEVVKTALRQNKCERILIISGFSEDLDFLEQAMQNGTEFLKKPFTFSGFQEKINILCKRFA